MSAKNTSHLDCGSYAFLRKGSQSRHFPNAIFYWFQWILCPTTIPWVMPMCIISSGEASLMRVVMLFRNQRRGCEFGAHGGGGPGELPWKILKSKLPESPFAAIWAWNLREYLDLMKGKMWIFKHISDNKIDRKIRKPHSQTPADIDDIIIRIAVYSKIIRGFSAWSNFMSIFDQFHWKIYLNQISYHFATIDILYIVVIARVWWA